jgi:SHS2 domain-containing protein
VSPFDTFEHTADIGLRVRAETLPELFAEAGKGLVSLLVEEPETIREIEAEKIVLEADSIENLLLDWLSELLFRFETKQRLVGACDVRLDGTRLQASVRGETADWDRHHPGREIKAVTYHRLRVERCEGEWMAEVLFDI